MIRLLRKNWKLNAIAVLSLAVALALSVVALSISNALLLRPPFAKDPGRLTILYTAVKPGDVENVSYPDYEYLRDQNRSFASMAAVPTSVSKTEVTFRGNQEMAITNSVSDNYFDVMGIKPFLGRFFAPGDDRKQVKSVMITYACWKRWGADPNIVGKTVKVNNTVEPIIGVAPKEFLCPFFAFGIASDVIVNLGSEASLQSADELKNRDRRHLRLIGRMKPDVAFAQARAESRGLWSQLAAAYPKIEKDRSLVLAPMTVLSPDDEKTGRLISAVLIACSLLILLIACANTANLLLALATLRRQEALIKTALGASRRRLIGEFLRETGVICGAGGLLGYGLALTALRRLSHFDLTLPAFGALPISVDLHPGLLVIAMTVGLIVLASLASGLAPAMYASKPNLASALSGEIAIGGTRRGWMRNIVVGVQVAVCTLVLAGAGLCWQSLHNLRKVDPGFSTRNIAMVMVFFETQNLAEPHSYQTKEELLQRVRQLHGVESAAFAFDLPLGGGNSCHDEIHFTDRPDETGKNTMIDCDIVDENYISTLGIRLLTGRDFRSSDREGAPEAIIVNRLMAEKFWPHQDAVGRTVLIGEKKEPATVIAVAADGKYDDLNEAPHPYIYHSLAQHWHGGGVLILKTAGDPRQWFQPMIKTARGLGLDAPLPPTTMDNWMNLTLFVPLLTMGCVTGLSALAMLLATVGLYGAISYSVSERRREIGIRIAVGARPAQVMQMVFRQTLWITGAGVVAGLAMSVGAGAMVADQFYQVKAVEWPVLLSVGTAMVALCLGIAFVAARRWTRMNPMEAVRHV